jgi:hypothetical protein
MTEATLFHQVKRVRERAHSMEVSTLCTHSFRASKFKQADLDGGSGQFSQA